MNSGQFELRDIGFLTFDIQILLICILFIITILSQYWEFKKTGKFLQGRFSSPTFFFFCPLYEEVIFRGFILFGLLSVYPVVTAVIVSSLLFGLWHFKNIFHYSKKELTLQIASNTIILGPLLAWLTILTGTIWLAVIVHYCCNLFASNALKKAEKIFCKPKLVCDREKF